MVYTCRFKKRGGEKPQFISRKRLYGFTNPCFFQEQFTPEWNHMPIHPLPPLQPQHAANAQAGQPQPQPPANAPPPGQFRRVAGQYKDWTNIYGIASVMWTLVTRRQPHHSPQPRHYDKAGYANLNPGPHLGIPNVNVPPAPAPAHWQTIPNQHWSYGCYLLDVIAGNPPRERYRSISPRLRHLIVRCMSDDPHHRPEVAEMRDEINWWMNRAHWQDAGGAPLQQQQQPGPGPGRRQNDDKSLRKEVRRCISEYPAGTRPSQDRLQRVCHPIFQSYISCIVDMSICRETARHNSGYRSI